MGEPGQNDDPSAPKTTAPVRGTPGGTTNQVIGYSKAQRRKDIVEQLKKDLATPAEYGSTMFNKYVLGYNADANLPEGYTTCGHFNPGVARMWVVDYYYKGDTKKWKKFSDLKKIESNAAKFIRNGTYALKNGADPKTCWKGSGGNARPKPGDFYALVEPVKTMKAGGTPAQQHTRGGSICHVGCIISVGSKRKATEKDLPFFKFEAQMKDGEAVIVKGVPQYIPSLPKPELEAWLASTEVEDWVTADAGQGKGLKGQKAMLVKRLYQPAQARITGESSQEPGDRWLEGWLDIDEFMHWPDFAAEVP